MWMLKYLICLMHDHDYTTLSCQGVDGLRQYHYCLRCGQVEGQDGVTQCHLAD